MLSIRKSIWSFPNMALYEPVIWFRMEGVEKYFSKKLRKRKTLSEADLPLKASVLTV